LCSGATRRRLPATPVLPLTPLASASVRLRAAVLGEERVSCVGCDSPERVFWAASSVPSLSAIEQDGLSAPELFRARWGGDP